jgi:CrcB protein
VTPLLVALGASVGAPARFALGRHLDRPGVHLGTLVANLLGSCLLGLLTGLAPSPHWMALLGTGFCGGFTTYSSFAAQAHAAGIRRGTAYVVATICLSLGACALGFAAGSL